MFRPRPLRPLVSAVVGILIAGGCVASPGRLSASSGQVTLDTQLDGTEVVSGQTINATVTVTNNGSANSQVALECGLPAELEAVVPVPVNPAGKTWAGVQGEFKDFVLASGTAPGGVPATDPMVVRTTGACPDGPMEATVLPHGSLTATAKFLADIVDGLPMPAGPIQVRVRLRHDATSGTANQAPAPGTPVSVQPKTYQEATESGTVTVTDSATSVVSLGQAVDGLLNDRGFVNWLSTTPSSTWTTANAFLMSGTGSGIEPNVPAWEIDLFSETNAPRTWAIGFIDAVTGSLLSTTYCNAPCDH